MVSELIRKWYVAEPCSRLAGRGVVGDVNLFLLTTFSLPQMMFEQGSRQLQT
jgi:hypothetical protein